MLAQRRARALTGSKTEEKETKDLLIGSYSGKDKEKCVPEESGLICEEKVKNANDIFQIFRPSSPGSRNHICARKLKNKCWTVTECHWKRKSYRCKRYDKYYKKKCESRIQKVSKIYRTCNRYYPWWEKRRECEMLPQAGGWMTKLEVHCRSPDSFRLKNSWNKKCLDMAYTGDVVVWDCHSGDNQRWFWAGNQLKNLASHRSKCLTMKGTNVEAVQCTSPSEESQIVYKERGNLKFMGSDRCVDKKWWSKYVIAYGCHSGSNQLWITSDDKEGDVPLR